MNKSTFATILTSDRINPIHIATNTAQNLGSPCIAVTPRPSRRARTMRPFNASTQVRGRGLRERPPAATWRIEEDFQ